MTGRAGSFLHLLSTAICAVLLLLVALATTTTDPVEAMESMGTASGMRPHSLQQSSPVFLPWVGSAAGAEVHVVGRLGGTTRALAANGLAYAAIDGRVAVFQTGSGGALEAKGETRSARSDIVAVAVDHSRLFTADSGATVTVHDLEGLELPVEASSANLGGELHDLGLVSGVVVVAHTSPESDELVFLEVSGLGLVAIARLPMTESVRSVAVTGDLVVCVTEKDRLIVVDASHASSPLLLSSTNLPVSGASSVAVGSGVAVVGHAGGLVAVDVADAEKPEVGAELSTADAVQDVDAASGHAFAATLSGMVVIEVGSANDLAIVATDPDSHPLLTIAYDATTGTVYGGGKTHQLVSWDVSVPDSPSKLGSLRAPADVVDLALVRDGIVTITNNPPSVTMVTGEPGIPLQVADAVEFTKITETITPQEVHVEGRTYYGYVWLYDALTSYDTSTPGNVQPRRTRSDPWAGGMSISGDYLYVARDGVVIVDASKASLLPDVGHSIEKAGTGKAITIEDESVYLAQRSSKGGNPTDLWIFDVGSPQTPVRVGVGHNIADPSSIAAVRGYIFVSGRGGADAEGLWVYDARDPSNVRPVGSVLLYPTAGRSRQVVRHTDRLYLVEEAVVDPYRGTPTGQNGVHVIDVRDPTHPERITFVPFEGLVGGIAVQDDLLYVAARGAGIFVLEVAAGR